MKHRYIATLRLGSIIGQQQQQQQQQSQSQSQRRRLTCAQKLTYS